MKIAKDINNQQDLDDFLNEPFTMPPLTRGIVTRKCDEFTEYLMECCYYMVYKDGIIERHF